MSHPPAEDRDSFPKSVLSATMWVPGIDSGSGFASGLAFTAELLFLLTLRFLVLGDCGSTCLETQHPKSLRQEDRGLETSLGYVGKHYLKKQNVFVSLRVLKSYKISKLINYQVRTAGIIPKKHPP